MPVPRPVSSSTAMPEKAAMMADEGVVFPTIQMCDALSRNTADAFKAIICNCLTHARRGFVDEVENFPEEAAYVIEALAQVYHIDAETKKQAMTPDQRLSYHKNTANH